MDEIRMKSSFSMSFVLLICVLAAMPFGNAEAARAKSWYVKNMVVVRSDNTTIAYDDRSGVFGRMKGAAEGYDKHDHKAYQSVAGSRAAIVFNQDEEAFGDEAGQYISDYRPDGNKRQVWTFTVTTTVPNAAVEIYWDGLYRITTHSDGSFSTELDNADRTAGNLRLIDLAKGRVVARLVRSKWRVQSYKFTMEPGETERHFRWVLGRPYRKDKVLAEDSPTLGVAAGKTNSTQSVNGFSRQTSSETEWDHPTFGRFPAPPSLESAIKDQ